MPYPSHRLDLSPFLIHLTRRHEGVSSAKESLQSIIRSNTLWPGIRLLQIEPALSDARYAVKQSMLTKEQKRRLFGFISFTEAPLQEVYKLCLIRDGRKKKLERYGLVFLKDWLMRLGASPVIYINNERGDKNEVLRCLADHLIRENLKGAEQILPLVAVFGKYLKPIDGGAQKKGRLDFTWEREWRLPYSESPILSLEEDKIFVGLCPDTEINEFEELLPSVPFIDPRNPKNYGATIKDRCQKMKLLLNPEEWPR
jgi:hypothetical protein